MYLAMNYDKMIQAVLDDNWEIVEKCSFDTPDSWLSASVKGFVSEYGKQISHGVEMPDFVSKNHDLTFAWLLV